MQVFEAEKNLGLHIKVKSSASILYNSRLIAGKLFSGEVLENIVMFDETLYPISDILVSTGKNLNDDVFNNIKMWKARKSPVYKPLDLNHDQNVIVGSIIGSRIINDDLEVIDDGDDSVVPESYHILNDSVIYRTWADEDRMTATDQMIEEIKNGEWFVSMECCFDGFDYFITAPDGTTFTIERTEETAFLTKYLRAYDGIGYYTDPSSGDKYEIARELNNIIFIGKGLVKEPGNPNSIIFANLVYKTEVEVVTSNKGEIITMADDKDKSKIVELETTVANLTKQLAEKSESAFSALQSKYDTSEKTIASLKTENTALAESVDKLSKANDDLQADMDKKDEKIKAMEDDSCKAKRKADMIAAGADEEEAESSVAEFAHLSDASFTSLVAKLTKVWNANKSVSDTSTAGQNLIDNANVVKDPVINVPSTTVTDTGMASASAYIGSFLKTGKKKSK